MDLTGVKFDEEEHVTRDETAQCPHLCREEVGGPQDLHVAADKFLPRRGLLTIGSSRDTPALEDIANRLIADLIAQMGQGTGDTVVTPAPILFGHLDNEVFEFLIDTRPSYGASLLGAVEFFGHELTMPGENGVGFDDVGDFFEGLLAQLYPNLSQRLALGVTEPETAFDLLS